MRREPVAKKAQEKKLDVAEMMMSRWMCGSTNMDRISNERIRLEPEGQQKLEKYPRKCREEGF